MLKTTLVYSTRYYAHMPRPLSFEPQAITKPVDRFMNAVYEHAKLVNARRRLIVKEGIYMYTPSNEYMIRFRNIGR